MAGKSIVYIIDDELAIRTIVSTLIQSPSRICRTYSSAEEFLDDDLKTGSTCLITDLHLPGMSGLTLQATLRSRGFQIPVILISGEVSVSASVCAMKTGAVTVLQKPLNWSELETAVQEALQLSESNCDSGWSDALRLLSRREREVATLIIDGKSTKEIGRALSISESTVHKHRMKVFAKLRVDSPTNLLLKSGFSHHFNRSRFCS